MNNTKNMSLWLGVLVAAVAAAILNNIVLLIGKPFTGLTTNITPLNVLPVTAWSVVGVIGAGVVFALIRRFAKRPNSVFKNTAIVVLILSFIPDVLIHGMTSGPFAGATWGAVFLLMLMHVVAAVVVLYVFLKNVRPHTAR